MSLLPAVLPAARPVYTADQAVATITAEVAPPKEPGFEASMVPWSVSKMNTAGTVPLVLRTPKSVVELWTWPVGLPVEPAVIPGIATVKVDFVAVLLWLIV
jgi:hypothetical protein